MATNPDRASYFPAIERKYGQPMSYWFDVMAEIKDLKYPEQMAYLQENHGFTRTHANALVLYSRGNTTSRRFNTVDEYLAAVDPAGADTARAILSSITRSYPGLDQVVAWNKPFLKSGTHYVFGVTVLSKYLLIAPTSTTVLEAFRPRLADYTVNKKTIQVPIGWKVDARLLRDMVGAQLAEIDG